MQLRQFSELDAGRRSYTFLTTTPATAPLANMPATFTQQVQALGATIGQIDAQASAQTAATGAITDKVSSALEAAKELRSAHLSPVKKVAKLITKGSAGGTLSPNFPYSITVPHVRNYSALLAATTATVQTVTPYKDLFVSRGLPSDFLDQLTAQATVLSQARQASGVAKQVRVSTTTDLKQLIQEMRSTMHVLEISVTRACKADRVSGPATMAGWKNAKAIRKGAIPTDIPFAPPVASAAQVPTQTVAQVPVGTIATANVSPAVQVSDTSPGASHT
jgi:hypothetical protein